jgi:PIN domain nuclease of toxin-antitoxin system
MAIKAALGRLRLAEPFEALLAADEFTELPMTLAHAGRLADLPPHHADPFDRMLVAQALTERATLVSHDRSLEPYGVPMVWT